MATPSSAPPILSRLDRLDLLLGYIEEMKVVRSSFTSTRSSDGGGDGDGGDRALKSSSMKIMVDKKSRPLAEVVAETQIKGTIVDRLAYLESRILEMSLEVEQEEIESEKSEEEKKRHKKGLKTLVRSCVKGAILKDKE